MMPEPGTSAMATMYYHACTVDRTTHHHHHWT